MINRPASKSVSDIPLARPRGPSFLSLVRNDRMEFLRELGRHGDLFRFRLLDRKIVVVTCPTLLHELLVTHAAALEKAPILRYMLYPLAGEGLFTSNGALWRRQRKVMAPIFPPAQVAHFADGIVACTRRDVEAWQDGTILDMARATTRITMSTAGRILFDAETFSEADELGAALTVCLEWSGQNASAILPIVQIGLRQALDRAADSLPEPVASRIRKLTGRMHGPLLFLSKEDRRMKDALTLLDRRVQRMVDERRTAKEVRSDLLGRLLAASGEDGSQMSDRQIRDEVLTLFIAGHETTASGLAWTLALLARHPAFYQRARAEVDALGRTPRYEDLPRLSFLSRAFKEALRLYPPVPLYLRDTTRSLSVGGHYLPAGTGLLFVPHATHRRTEPWPDPERFDPDRFTPEAEATRPRLAYLPFSAGPRTCIGNHLALMEGPLILATLLQHADFALTSSAPIEPDMQATLRPRSGVPMRVLLRRPAPPAEPPRPVSHPAVAPAQGF